MKNLILTLGVVAVLYGCAKKATDNGTLDKENEKNSKSLINRYHALSDWYEEERYSISYESELLDKMVAFKGLIKDIYQEEGDSSKFMLVYGLGDAVNHVFFSKIQINQQQYENILNDTKEHKFNRNATVIIKINSIHPQESNVKLIQSDEQVDENTYDESIKTVISPIAIRFDAQLVDFYIDKE